MYKQISKLVRRLTDTSTEGQNDVIRRLTSWRQGNITTQHENEMTVQWNSIRRIETKARSTFCWSLNCYAGAILIKVEKNVTDGQSQLNAWKNWWSTDNVTN